MTRIFLLLSAGSLVFVGCGSAQNPAASRTTSAALTVEPTEKAAGDEKTAAEKWAEEKVAADAKNAKATDKGQGGDPLAMNDALEESSIPKIDMTPAKELRAKGRADLDAAVALVQTESSLDGAAKKLTARLGKPTWTENGARRVWVAAAGAQCHRLVLEADGTVEVETAAASESRMLTATARQNPCTGEIKRGIEK